jgi:hypothetical protein
MKKSDETVWYSAKVQANENEQHKNSARALGISKSEFLRRALRVATPILLATPTAGVKIRDKVAR